MIIPLVDPTKIIVPSGDHLTKEEFIFLIVSLTVIIIVAVTYNLVKLSKENNKNTPITKWFLYHY